MQHCRRSLSHRLSAKAEKSSHSLVFRTATAELYKSLLYVGKAANLRTRVRSYTRITGKIRADLKRVESQMMDADRAELFEGLTGHVDEWPEIAQRWRSLPLGRRRAVVETLWSSITLTSSTPVLEPSADAQRIVDANDGRVPVVFLVDEPVNAVWTMGDEVPDTGLKITLGDAVEVTPEEATAAPSPGNPQSTAEERQFVEMVNAERAKRGLDQPFRPGRPRHLLLERHGQRHPRNLHPLTLPTGQQVRVLVRGQDLQLTHRLVGVGHRVRGVQGDGDLLPGDLCLYGRSPSRISHVAVYLGPGIIEAGGGDSTTTSVEEALKRRDARVRRRALPNYRGDLKGYRRLSLEELAADCRRAPCRRYARERAGKADSKQMSVPTAPNGRAKGASDRPRPKPRPLATSPPVNHAGLTKGMRSAMGSIRPNPLVMALTMTSKAGRSQCESTRKNAPTPSATIMNPTPTLAGMRGPRRSAT